MNLAEEWDTIKAAPTKQEAVPQRRSTDRARILSEELDSERRALASDPEGRTGPHAQNVAALEKEMGGAPAATSAPLAAEWDSIKPEEAKPAEAAKPAPKEAIPWWKSFGAAAGEATGRGVLAVQQLAGKGVGKVGELADVDSLKTAGDWLNRDAVEGAKRLSSEAAPYQEANPKSALAGEVTGLVFNPVNKLIPAGKAASTLVGSVAQGAAQGAALNALTSPVTEEKPFLWEKLKQGTIGALGGAAGGGVGFGLSKALNKGMELFQRAANRATVNPGQAAEQMVVQTLGSDAAAIKAERPELFSGLKEQVQDALASGKKVDPLALERLARAQSLPVPVPMLKGQITRDAMQFAKEQNLRGITGVGEPLTETLTSQNRALIGNLDALGASAGSDVVTAGKSAIDVLRGFGKSSGDRVTRAYNAFKESTGKSLDVPLQGIAQDYAKVLRERGSAIPAEVRREFESYGILTGKAQKTLTIDEAEGLIKNFINKNYDPANKVASGALDELRQSVQKAITEGAGSNAEGAAAAALAKEARTAAKARFDLIDTTPGLKAALRGEQPDKFIQKFILQGNAAEIKNLMGVLRQSDPSAAKSVEDALLAHIKQKSINMRSDGNGTFSQDQLKQFVANPQMAARISEVLGPEKMKALKQLNLVAEDALFAPTASAVNRSNTASAAANLVKQEVQSGSLNSLLDIAKKVPGLSTAANMAQGAHQSRMAGGLVNEAVNPSLSQTGANNILDMVSRRVRPDIAAARAGAATLQERNRQADRRNKQDQRAGSR